MKSYLAVSIVTAAFSSLTSFAATFCPTGATFNPATRMCESSDSAIGPFSPTMIAKCKEFGGGTLACEGGKWNLGFARSLRGTSVCPPGTVMDSNLNTCAEGMNVYGPFSVELVNSCKKLGGGSTCEFMRWHRSFIPVKAAVGSVENRKIFDFYSVESNYNRVFDDVMDWFGTTKNGCVAFMSSAMRIAGVDVPKFGTFDDERISLVTLPFSKHLEITKKWKRIPNARDLQPGDIVFTEDAPEFPGYPAHVYMFHSWKDKVNFTALVVDNQDFTHVRNVFSNGTFNFTPFAYALRSPR